MKLTSDQLGRIKDENPCHEYAAGMVRLRKAGKGFVGPCPFCSNDLQSTTDARFDVNADRWVCAVCVAGGDIIALVARDHGLDPQSDFRAIIDILGGADAAREETPESAARAGGRAQRANEPCEVPPAFERFAGDWLKGYRESARKAQAGDRYRERERVRLFKNYWTKAVPFRGTPVERYLVDVRGLAVPPNAFLRYLDDCPMFADGTEKEPLLVHRGPAMLAAIWSVTPLATPETVALGTGYRFGGLHFTFLDFAQAKGKAIIRHPDTGEELPAKKSRGSKQGGYIDLGGARPQDAETMFAAEGIENTLFAFTGLQRAGRDVSRVHFRCGIDLGNLAGKALDRVRHPTLTNANGRARMVPGIEPDMSSAAMPIPAGIRRQVWLCDGDSDPLLTRNAMERARARNARDDLDQVMLWPDHGQDWNDRIFPK